MPRNSGQQFSAVLVDLELSLLDRTLRLNLQFHDLGQFMSDVVIKVENLSKKYVISHQSHERYTALRDVMANGVKILSRKILSPFAFRDSPLSEAQEDFYALRDVSFEIKQGDRVGIIGRNGAGKSTLLKILSRITEPTSGKIEITGRVASLLEVGTGFHPELTGRENIFLNGAILGMGKAEIKRKFDEIVEFAEVEKFLDTPVKRYSSGMYVRLAFSVAAHLETEILLVDEVLAVGDAQFQKKCMGKMSEVGQDGKTVFFVSHNMGAVANLCTSGLHLLNGKSKYYSDISGCISAYLSHMSGKTNEVINYTGVKRPPELNLREGAKFINARMISEKQEIPWQIPFPLNPVFEFSIVVEKNVPKLELGLALYNYSNVEIASNLSSDKLQMENLQPGTYKIVVEYQDLNLLPARYYLALGLRTDIGMEDYIPDAAQFEIITSTASAVARTYIRKGILIPKVEYSINNQG